MAIEVPDWYRTVALVGVDDTGEPVVVLLDSTGAIVAVMKGEYAGTLKTLATDEDGRLIAILTDPADIWGVFRHMGLAEHAAVFSFAKRFDKRGDVIFLDNFEEGMAGWFTATTGSGASVALSTDIPAFGGFCVHLTTGGADGDYATISRYLGYPKLVKVGIGFSFTMQSYDSYISTLVVPYDGANRYIGEVRYNPSTDELEYYDENGAYVVFATGVDLLISPYGYNHMKMVIDLATGEYVRFLLNATEYDMSGYLLYSSVSVHVPVMEMTAWLETNQAANALSRIDGFVCTQNEP